MPTNGPPNEDALLERLRAGDEAAFAALVDGLHGRLLALCRTFTSSPALAEDIVQETWLAVIRGLPGFEGRASLRTWIFSILVRRARTLAAREARRATVPLGDGHGEAAERAPEWEPGRGKLGLWEGRPVPWHLEDPAALAQSREALAVVERAVAEMPESQRRVLLLRDVEDVPARDVCNILDIKETHLRVLLHRGRARVRRALDQYLRAGEGPAGPEGRRGTRDAEGAPGPPPDAPA